VLWMLGETYHKEGGCFYTPFLCLLRSCMTEHWYKEVTRMAGLSVKGRIQSRYSHDGLVITVIHSCIERIPRPWSGSRP